MGIEKLNLVWPEWTVTEQLGEGTFGKVYKAVRDQHGVISTAAIKVISIPQNEAEVLSVRFEGLDENGTRAYFESVVSNFINEIKAMESLKGTSNIVNIEDYNVLEDTDKIGWHIFIRMELLTPLTYYRAVKTMDEAEVLKLGQDLCQALELCAQRNIIHRDIKPENIFVSSFGDFKIGDFGVARELKKTSSLSKKGTPNFMAPEVNEGKTYDLTADIYSLGLVLYMLLNNNRLPFLDPYAQIVSFQDKQNALNRRLSGEELPAPCEASTKTAQIIQAACAFDPAKRFQTPTAFKNILASMAGRVSDTVPPPVAAPVAAPVEEPIVTPVRPATPEAPRQVHVPVIDYSWDNTWKIKLGFFAVTVVALIIAGYMGINFIRSGGSQVTNVMTQLETGNHSHALLLAGNISSNMQQRSLQNNLQNRLNAITVEFLSNDIDYGTALTEISAIERMGFDVLYDNIANSRDSITRINNSRVAFNTAETMYARGNFSTAITHFGMVEQDDTNYFTAMQGLRRASDAYREIALANAENYYDLGNYGAAIRVLDSALRVIENDSALMQQLANFQESYIDEVIARVGEMVEYGDYASAVSRLNSALFMLPNNTRLSMEVDRVEGLRPVSLGTVTLVDSYGYEHVLENITDSFGNVHNQGHSFAPRHGPWSHNHRDAHSKYNLNRDFTMFTAYFVAPSGLDTNLVFTVEIFLDSDPMPVIRLEDFTVRTSPTPISIDVTGTTTMDIRVAARSTGRYTSPRHSIYLVNTLLTR